MSYSVVLTVAVAVIYISSSQGWFFGEEHTTRSPDGSLRCYQCNSSADPDEPDPKKSVCTLGNWRHANVTQKRNMIMQCPRSRSSFCHLALGLDESKAETIRGCSGPTYEDGKDAHIGCFFMGDQYRVCLCDTNLCNDANSVANLWWLGVVVFVANACLS